ncbi:MAG: hypothetical protein HFE93_02540 [Acutalibacter muris]|nr:hypothetical protein [Acutalibacter muris]
MKKRALVLNGGNLDPSGIKRSVQVPIELGAIRAPTLVLAGTRDMVKESHTRLIARSIPGAKLSIIEGDHFIAGKKPERFNAAVGEFLKEIEENC